MIFREDLFLYNCPQESLFGSPGGASELGPNTLEAVDAEIKVLLNSSYSRALKILQVHIAFPLAMQQISDVVI